MGRHTVYPEISPRPRAQRLVQRATALASRAGPLFAALAVVVLLSWMQAQDAAEQAYADGFAMGQAVAHTELQGTVAAAYEVGLRDGQASLLASGSDQ